MANPIFSSGSDFEAAPSVAGPILAPAPLTALAPGCSGVIVAVDAEASIARRLLDLGFVPGSRVTAIRRAPLGDPVEYEVRGMRICLRDSEASRIQVRFTDRA